MAGGCGMLDPQRRTTTAPPAPLPAPPEVPAGPGVRVEREVRRAWRVTDDRCGHSWVRRTRLGARWLAKRQRRHQGGHRSAAHR